MFQHCQNKCKCCKNLRLLYMELVSYFVNGTMTVGRFCKYKNPRNATYGAGCAQYWVIDKHKLYGNERANGQLKKQATNFHDDAYWKAKRYHTQTILNPTEIIMNG